MKTPPLMPQPDPHISALLRDGIHAGDFPSAVDLVAERGRIRFTEALGDAARAPVLRAATPTTIYDLASLTKPLVTGLLCARLQERGGLSLDEPIARHLDAFAIDDKATLTPRQLLTHTSGLPAWLPLYLETDGVAARALEVIARTPLVAAPGTRVIYSDLGFITLGLLLERIGGAPLAALAREEIFAPLRLTRTGFNPAPELRDEIAASESNGNDHERRMCAANAPDGSARRDYQGWRKEVVWGTVHDGNAHFLGGVAGHAGLFSDADETYRLARQFIAGESELLTDETCTRFRTNLTDGLNEARSFAWQLAATPDSTAGTTLASDAFGHLGFTGTSCWIDAAQQRVFILLTNRTHESASPFVNLNRTRREFHTLAAHALDAES